MDIQVKIQALRDIAKILDYANMFFDVNGVKSEFTIEDTGVCVDSVPIYLIDEPVLDADTFRDIADDLDQLYP